MKKIFFILLMFVSTFSATHACPEILAPTLEKHGKVRFCRLEKLMVSRNCYNKRLNCNLVKDLKKLDQKLQKIKETLVTEKQNPGAYVCNQLGWQIIMGRMSDGSELCTCRHPKKSFIICTSLI